VEQSGQTTSESVVPQFGHLMVEQVEQFRGMLGDPLRNGVQRFPREEHISHEQQHNPLGGYGLPYIIGGQMSPEQFAELQTLEIVVQQRQGADLKTAESQAAGRGGRSQGEVRCLVRSGRAVPLASRAIHADILARRKLLIRRRAFRALEQPFAPHEAGARRKKVAKKVRANALDVS
jgi:hypothetical protein